MFEDVFGGADDKGTGLEVDDIFDRTPIKGGCSMHCKMDMDAIGANLVDDSKLFLEIDQR